MGTSCKESGQALVDCMKKSKCMREGGDFKSCLKMSKENDECQVRKGMNEPLFSKQLG